MTDPLEKWDGLMFQAVSESIEDMAFMEVLPNKDASGPTGLSGDVIRASLPVQDPVQGEFVICLNKDLLINIAETVYGPMVDELRDQNLFDLLGEILNTVVGRFMSAIVPGDRTFRLGLPISGKGIAPEPLSPAYAWYYLINDSDVYLAVSGESLPALRKMS